MENETSLETGFISSQHDPTAASGEGGRADVRVSHRRAGCAGAREAARWRTVTAPRMGAGAASSWPCWTHAKPFALISHFHLSINLEAVSIFIHSLEVRKARHRAARHPPAHMAEAWWGAG